MKTSIASAWGITQAAGMLPWHERAEAVAAALAAERLDWPEKVAEPIGVGCSGGADSVCLLLLAWLRYGNELRVLHLNHGLRGAESDADAAFVENLAGELGVGFVGDKLEGLPEEPSEALLRERRLDFYRQSGCATVLLGHHADDVAETLLMRLSRGSGTEGLAAPLPTQRFSDGLALIRPLLAISKAKLLDALAKNDMPWREDASNAAPDYFRNRVRADVLPALLAAAPGNARTGLARSHRLLAEDAEALNAWLNTLGLKIEACKPLDLALLRHTPVALWRRALQRWLAVNGLREHLSAGAVDALLDELRTGRNGRFSAGARTWLVFDWGRLMLEKPVEGENSPWPDTCLRPGQTLNLPTGHELKAELVSLDDVTCAAILKGKFDNRTCVYLEANGLRFPLLVRQWRDGDRYLPLGAPGTRKLQDCFTDAKIPARERKQLPVVCWGSGNIILWVPGLPPDEYVKVTTGTVLALRLTYSAYSQKIAAFV
ncbi:MAG: tRNA lysidine(34) synthetase TilS [Verrucomicrobiota bacterium JB024]|nr:tRNA lysidine(34) synthetase TilS [Verrucomicrobiota bacterium JB024]